MTKAKFEETNRRSLGNETWESLGNVTWSSLNDKHDGYQAYKLLWEKCKSYVTQDKEQNEKLDIQLREHHEIIARFAAGLAEFKNALRNTPIIIVIGEWMRGLALDLHWGEKYIPRMLKLLKKNIIPLKYDNNDVTLEYFITRGHQDILEQIRCIEGWSIFEKEEGVQTYIQFSRSLNRQTHGIVPPGFDPDRDRARNKAVRYEHFIEFVQHLPYRDSLIAKLLYFGAPSMEEVLSLKRDAIGSDNLLISFENDSKSFPRHVILDLRAYIADLNKGQKLVFANLRGAEVERAHLNQSFARACEKMSMKRKITPGSLLRLENESEKITFDGVLEPDK